jgi:CRISPR/Cas system-associated protein endoribonuclease Cas2
MQAQAAAGAQQQGLEQQKMSQAYQDFLSQRGYPQQQLAFMSDILRGVPLGQQTQVQYQAPPPMTSQLAQLGLGAYGVSQMMKNKEGGIIKMAEGGIAGAAPQGDTPTTVPIDKLRSMLGRMDEEQLAQVEAGTGDATTLALVQEQRNLNERIRVLQIISGGVGIDGTEEALSWAYMVNNEYRISLLKEGYIFLIELSNNGSINGCRRHVRAKFIST